VSLETRLSRRITSALLSSLLLMTMAASATVAQSPSVGVDPSASVSAPDATPDPVDSAIPAVPNPTVTGALPQPWDHIDVAPDGKTLTVYFWMGASGCYGMQDVQVTVVDGVTIVSVSTGLLPEAIDRLCVEALFLYKTDVVLDAPVLGGGAI
jgi:hypothetical protein